MTLKTPPDDAVGHVFREVTSAAVTLGQLHKTASEVPSLLRSRRAPGSMSKRVFTARTRRIALLLKSLCLADVSTGCQVLQTRKVSQPFVSVQILFWGTVSR